MSRLICILFLLLPILSFSSNRGRLKEAHELVKDGYFAEADSIYISCLETATDSEMVEIYIKLAEVRLRTSEVKQAKKYLTKAVENSVDDKQLSKSKMVLGLAYLNFDVKLDSAIQLMDQAIILNEEYYGQYQSNLASYYKRTKQYELAVLANERAIQYFLTHPSTDTSKVTDDSLLIYIAYYNLGQAYKEFDRFKALDAYLKAAEYLPEQNIAKAPRVYARIAEEYRFINDVRKAEKYEKMALEAQRIKDEHIDGSFEKELREKEQKAELESQRNTKLIIGGVLLVLAGLGGRILMKRKMNKN
tara:strand:- start:1732 stop:2643 length:912 start_codon:yes stop_codon:yes gene_type:complete